jgi:hypothetical protein
MKNPDLILLTLLLAPLALLHSADA